MFMIEFEAVCSTLEIQMTDAKATHSHCPRWLDFDDRWKAQNQNKDRLLMNRINAKMLITNEDKSNLTLLPFWGIIPPHEMAV